MPDDARPAAAFNRILLLMARRRRYKRAAVSAQDRGSKMRAGNAETARVARCADR